MRTMTILLNLLLLAGVAVHAQEPVDPLDKPMDDAEAILR